jgi:hypothetical protein
LLSRSAVPHRYFGTVSQPDFFGGIALEDHPVAVIPPHHVEIAMAGALGDPRLADAWMR